MEKIIIEHNIKNIEWEEDEENLALPDLTEMQRESFFKACDSFYGMTSGEDRLHYFIIIDGNNVEIIPASQYHPDEYNKKEAQK